MHGGPFADRFVLENHDEMKRKAESVKICEMAFQLALSVKAFTFMSAVRIDNKYGELFNKINVVRVRWAGKST